MISPALHIIIVMPKCYDVCLSIHIWFDVDFGGKKNQWHDIIQQ